MSDITISRSVQIGLLTILLAALTATIARELPEIQRYLKIESM